MKTMYAPIQTIDGDIHTFGANAFATRQECVDWLAAMFEDDLKEGEFMDMEDCTDDIKSKIDEMREKLADSNLFVDDVSEYTVVEIDILDKAFAEAKEKIEDRE